MKYFSLFSGVGGFELSINNVYANKNDKWTVPSLSTERDLPDSNSRVGRDEEQRSICIGFSEIDKYAISVYQYHYKHKNYGDISKIDWNTVPDFDLVVGGSPCQDLSVAGKQKGLSGARSGLFFEYVRCLKEKQPTNFIWENVKGALSSSNGWDFARVQIEFSEAGYDIEWQVLNAKDFGVPQNRERIFVVGHLRGKSEPKVFPIRTANEVVIGERDTQTANTLTSNYWKGAAASRQIVRVREATQKGYAEAVVGDSINFSVPNSKTRRGRVGHGVAQTLDTASNQGTIDGTRIRRLTPLECERLMSWPDNWTKTGITGEISDTQRYKMCGNGVVSKVIEPIMEKLWNNTPTTWA